MLLNDEERKAVWDRAYSELQFKPFCKNPSHSMTEEVPFVISKPYTVYSLDNVRQEQIELFREKVRNCLVKCGGDRWYALDWQHSAFLFDPMNIEEQKSFTVEDDSYPDGEHCADFPMFYPDGDYYFFIDEAFENGYLGHPWRKEVWVFGDKLEWEVKKTRRELGLEPIYKTPLFERLAYRIKK